MSFNDRDFWREVDNYFHPSRPTLEQKFQDKLNELELAFSQCRQMLRDTYELVHKQQLDLHEQQKSLFALNQRLFQAERAEKFLLELGFKRDINGVWVCQTPAHGPRQIEASTSSSNASGDE